MHRPGAITHHCCPVCSASLLSAQCSMVPQLTEDGLPSPMNCRPAAVSTAYSAAPRKLAAISDVIVGRISTTIT